MSHADTNEITKHLKSTAFPSGFSGMTAILSSQCTHALTTSAPTKQNAAVENPGSTLNGTWKGHIVRPLGDVSTNTIGATS